MPNPFYYGGGITEPRYFVGRRAELEHIFAALAALADGQAQHVSIYGPRRIGKSSLLRQVARLAPDRAPAGHRVCYLDAQDMPTPAAFARALFAALDAHPSPREASLDALEAHLRAGEGAPVVLLDELDAWLKPQRPFDDLFFDRLRSWMNAHLLAMVVVSKAPLAELVSAGRYTSPFFNIFGTSLALGPLPEAEAEELLARARTCDRPFGARDLAWVKAQARVRGGYHPARLQLAGRLLYQAKAQPPVDYGRLAREFARQWADIAPQPSPRRRLAAAGGKVLRLPQPLGQAVLDLLGRQATAPATSALVGWAVFLLVVLALAGLVPWGPLVRWLLGLLGFHPA